ncbi:HD domain-containing protein [Streptomyces ziwulingensis]|uniref:ATP-binding protein n=1 Tax=Streptomyces ziwulingensis TaxID=1045501 RepID=A0ABP9BLJ9_9ACTN
MTEPLDYWTALARLVRLAEEPQAAAVRAAMKREAERDQRVPSDNTVADWVARRTIPRAEPELKLFLTALHHLARQRRRDPAPAFPSWSQWQRMAREARRERRTGAKPRPVRETAAPPPAPLRPDWAEEAAGASVWGLVKPGDAERAEALRSQTRAFADRLARAYEETREALGDDPWLDRNLGRRISGRGNKLVHHLWSRTDGFLEPAEAAVSALLPFLYQTHRARTALELRHVEPTDLGQQASPGELRRMYEVVLRAHERLTRRAELGGLKDRADGRTEIGWWLFHQWAKRQPGRIGELLSVLDGPTGPLEELRVVLDPALVSRLLSCAHTGPFELFDPARADHLREDPFDLDFRGRDFQCVRERLVGPLFALAHRMAIEAADLSSVIVRHVGIPDALDLGAFLATAEAASWQFARDGVALKASCSHPAAVAALTEHVRGLEPLLRSVRHAGAADFGELPVYTRADDVREVDATGRPVAVGGVIRFRIDEERVQELLMGENLYRDRSLAVRELYQNALDACRYRRARSQAADPHSSYPGRIEFVQGWDEEEGRHYLECRDNGVGMDELTLSEVFSQAGIRFTDLPRYQEERQEWQSRGVTMHPNSRFGIGVLSYFMLADEIRVTTCHMDAVAGRLREISVLITGPGHYFRVRPTGRPGTIGTTVRLYLRDGDKAPSCVRELRRLLGFSEFTTTARHHTLEASWDAGEPRPREALGIRSEGYHAHGRFVPWSAGRDRADGHVVWCRHGGGVLVDGIHCEPRVRQAILNRLGGTGALRGVIVNLTGATRPRRLSVDRGEILDPDVCADIERLVQAALPALLTADPPLLNRAWLTEVANHSPRLADLVTEAAGAGGYALETEGRTASVAGTGFFPPDPDILSGRDLLEEGGSMRTRRGPYLAADDATRLWRLLAHRPSPTLTALTELVPELDRVRRVLPALPSDALLRATKRTDGPPGPWPRHHQDKLRNTPAFVALVARTRGLRYRDAMARMTELRLPVPPRPQGDPEIDETGRALLSSDLTGIDFRDSSRSLATRRTVPPGHLLKAQHEFGISLGEAAARMRTFGFTVPDLAPSAEDADELTLRLLSVHLDGRSPWLDAGTPVPPQHLIDAHSRLGLGIRTAAATLRAFGCTVRGDDRVAERPEETLALIGRRTALRPSAARHTSRPVPPVHVFEKALELNRPPGKVAQDLRALGFEVWLSAAQEGLTTDVLREYEAHGWTCADWDHVGRRAVPPGLLLRTASRQGVAVQEAATRIGALGFTAPPVPPSPKTADIVLLSEALSGAAPWREAGAVVSLAEIVEASLLTGLAPAAVVTRLRLYGLVPPDTPMPPSARHSDLLFLGEARYSRLDAGQPVPVGLVLRTAQALAVAPEEIAGRVARYGLETRAVRWPALTDENSPLSRLMTMELDLDGAGPIPLYQVIHASESLSLPLGEVAELVSRLGLTVQGGEVSSVDAVDIRLCDAAAPLRARSGRLLALAEPFPDFVRLVRVWGAAEGLLDRLRHLGVDLRPLRDAVLAALSDVPGLVLEPGAELPAT